MKRPPNVDEYIRRYNNGEITARGAAAELGLAKSTFIDWAKAERITNQQRDK